MKAVNINQHITNQPATNALFKNYYLCSLNTEKTIICTLIR